MVVSCFTPNLALIRVTVSEKTGVMGGRALDDGRTTNICATTELCCAVAARDVKRVAEERHLTVPKIYNDQLL